MEMKEAGFVEIEQIVNKQRAFFNTNATKSIYYRKNALVRLEYEIRRNIDVIQEALKSDLNKSYTESYMTEVGFALSELGFIKRHFENWAKERPVVTPVAQFPSVSFVKPEPLGVALIMAPWNYPFLLSVQPLFGAIAAGNCCIIKPSEEAPATSAVLAKIINSIFPDYYIHVIEGDATIASGLLDQRFDHIFFTGSINVGKIVMKNAAENLTPVTLELGGKSPCIIDSTANIKVAAKRIAFGKCTNSGQTCVAPDYLLVEKCIKSEFIRQYKIAVREMFGSDAINNPDYPRMINHKHFDRVHRLFKDEKVVMGGKSDSELLKIEPTLLDDVAWDAPIMQEEIFGPVLPMITYENLEDVISYVKDGEKPLALYLFSNDREVGKRILQELPFGGGCINDTIIHLATSYMGFGGVGNSGMGRYHGKYSFETFSNLKSIVWKSDKLDLPMRYQPYTGFKKKLIRTFLK